MAGDIHIHMNAPNGGNSPVAQKLKAGKVPLPTGKSGPAKAAKPVLPAARSSLKPQVAKQTAPKSTAPSAQKGSAAGTPKSGKPTPNAKGPSVGGSPLAQQGKGTQAGPIQGPLLGTQQSQNFPGLAGERQQQPKPPVPKKPPKEPKVPPEVAQARAQQDSVLKNRMARETRGRIGGSPRDVNAGAGMWPPLSPLL